MAAQETGKTTVHGTHAKQSSVRPGGSARRGSPVKRGEAEIARRLASHLPTLPTPVAARISSGKLRRLPPTEATRLWSAMAQGLWSPLGETEADGIRIVVAKRNAPGRKRAEPIEELSGPESEVVWLAVHGHPRKYIAIELGISVASVGRRLRSALVKLELGSRRDLLRQLGGGAAGHRPD